MNILNSYNKRPTSSEDNKYFSASHIMLFCILLMYVLVGISCLIFIDKSIANERFDSATQMVYALCSYSAVCGSSTIVVYASKASKENNLKIANSRFKMKIELAKEIYRNIQNGKLDDKSIALIVFLTKEEKDDSTADILTNLNITNPMTDFYNNSNNNTDVTISG